MLKPRINPKLLLLAAAILFLYHNKTCTKEEINQLFKPITFKYGIKIVYEIGPDFLSHLVNPGIAAGPARHSKVLPMEHWVLARYPHILQEALEKYPVEIIKKYLKAIYLAKEINEDGFNYGGSYDTYKRVIYLVNNGRKSDHLSIAT
jgi:hypothetical protein